MSEVKCKNYCYDESTGRWTPITKVHQESKHDFKLYTNRKSLAGTVSAAGSASTLYTGEFVAVHIIISNNGTVDTWCELLDGDNSVFGGSNYKLAAQSHIELKGFMLFNTSVKINAGSTAVKFWINGYTA